MKIIGETQSGYILQADYNEIANIIGYYSKFSMDKSLPVGTKIEIASMYKYLYEMASLNDDMKKYADKFESYTKQLRSLPDPITFNKDDLND